MRLTIDTSQRWYVDLTADVAEFVRTLGDGLVNVFVPHATAGIAIMELGDGSEDDFRALLQRLLPRDDALYRHHHGFPGHGADHLIPALISSSTTVPVLEGRLALGIWQHIVLIDTNVDNPQREVVLSFLSDQ